MTKPHEERWAAHKDCVVEPTSWKTIFIPHEDFRDDELARDRAQFAAQAPAMARLLLKLGAKFGPSDDGYRVCSCCEAEAHATSAVPHTEDCALATVLRAAGALP